MTRGGVCGQDGFCLFIEATKEDLNFNRISSAEVIFLGTQLVLKSGIKVIHGKSESVRGRIF